MENVTWQESIKPSSHFALLLATLHLASVMMIDMTSIIWIVKAIFVLLIVWSWFYYLKRDILQQRPNSWFDIKLQQSHISIGSRDGKTLTGQLVNSSVVFDHFVLLSVKLDGGKFVTSRMIFQDAIQPKAFRELCVYLKFSC